MKTKLCVLLVLVSSVFVFTDVKIIHDVHWKNVSIDGNIIKGTIATEYEIVKKGGSLKKLKSVLKDKINSDAKKWTATKFKVDHVGECEGFKIVHTEVLKDSGGTMKMKLETYIGSRNGKVVIAAYCKEILQATEGKKMLREFASFAVVKKKASDIFHFSSWRYYKLKNTSWVIRNKTVMNKILEKTKENFVEKRNTWKSSL